MRIFVLSLFLTGNLTFASQTKCGSIRHASNDEPPGVDYIREANDGDEYKIIPLNEKVDTTLSTLKQWTWICLVGTEYVADGRWAFHAYAVSTVSQSR